MRRWAMPATVLVIFFGVAVGLTLVPTKAHKEDCHQSAIAIVTGAHVPEEIKHECEEAARNEMFVAAIPATAGVIATVATVTIMRRADSETGPKDEGGEVAEEADRPGPGQEAAEPA